MEKRLVAVAASLVVLTSCGGTDATEQAGPVETAIAPTNPDDTGAPPTDDGKPDGATRFGTYDCARIDGAALSAAMGGDVTPDPEPIFSGDNMGIAGACEFVVDLEPLVMPGEGDLTVLVFEDSTWPPTDLDDTVDVAGVGEAALFSSATLWVQTAVGVLAVSLPGEMAMTLDDDVLIEMASQVAHAAIDAFD